MIYFRIIFLGKHIDLLINLTSFLQESDLIDEDENLVDEHQDMRLDIDSMSYEVSTYTAIQIVFSY